MTEAIQTLHLWLHHLYLQIENLMKPPKVLRVPNLKNTQIHICHQVKKKYNEHKFKLAEDNPQQFQQLTYYKFRIEEYNVLVHQVQVIHYKFQLEMRNVLELRLLNSFRHWLRNSLVTIDENQQMIQNLNQISRKIRIFDKMVQMSNTMKFSYKLCS